MTSIIFIADVLLISISFLWLIYASITDLKKREIPNWISFTLLPIALVIRALVAIIEKQPTYFLYALVAFAIFFIITNLFYYTKIFAGGDTKLLLALSVVFATTPSFAKNIQLFSFSVLGISEPFLLTFLVNIFVLGSVHGLIFSINTAIKNKKFVPEFEKTLKKMKSTNFVCWLIALACLIFALFIYNWFFINFIIFLILPFLYAFIKAAENSAMIKKIPANKVTEGDWIVKSIKVKNKIIKPSVHGLSKEEISLLKKAKKQVIVKYGLPFIPIFLLSIICSLFFGNLLMLLFLIFI